MSKQINIAEKTLVDKALQNDRLAQKEIFDKYYVSMYTSAYRITDNKELALDAVQEAFVKVFRYLHTFKYKSSLYTWIKRILVREAVQVTKDNTHFESLDQKVSGEYIEWQDGFTGEYLQKAILSLPDGYRKIFTLIEVEGYSHKEIAEMFSISIGTSKSQLFYAKKALQKILSNFDVQD